MIAKFIDSTNLLMLESYKGLVGQFSMRGGMAFLEKNEIECFRTSFVLDYKLFENKALEIHTLNSIYTFEIIKGKFDPSGIEKAPEALLQYSQQINSAKHRHWFCQIKAPGMLDSIISTVTLPTEMTRSEAQRYILENCAVDDSEGYPIAMLYTPIMEQKND